MCSLTSPRLVRNENVIDEEATFEKFGYYSRDFKPKSDKKIVAVCEDCGNVRIIKKRYHHALCPSCVRKGAKSPHWKGGKAKRICLTCGTEFPVEHALIKRGGGKFCSPKCYGKWKSKHWKGKNNANWKGGKIKRICETCGTEFPLHPSLIKQGRGRFCSPKCMGKWLSKHNKGKNNPSWKNGASFEPYCSKFNEEFKEYIRDKFGRVCFLCPKTEEENGRKLSVHHVNYNKDCGCDNDETCQFVPLCNKCNAKVNFNREMWEKKIKAKMRNKLNGWFI